MDSDNINQARDLPIIDEEEPQVKETLEWISNEDESFPFTLSEMKEWIVEGDRINDIKNETKFCNSEMLQEILEAKNIFDIYGIKPLIRARYRANAFETIGSVFFMNRAALKMANIDAATNFMFTNIDENSDHKTNSAPYYFADVCAGPGGFTEYLLWRKKWLFKGFGFTLKDDNDFRLTHSKHISSATFNGHYGYYGDGDIFKIENIEHFTKRVKHETDNLGVHFMMSDGGFSVQGEENLQEILSKQLYICQCLMALEIVRINGHFVTKLFDLLTPFSIGLIYFMYKCFKKIAILKPNTSRPANAERYLICCQLRNMEEIKLIKSHLTSIASRLWEIRGVQRNTKIDVNEIIPLQIIKKDDKFYKYIIESNNKIGKRQIFGLRNMERYLNKSACYSKQEMLRSQCLEYWKIPDYVKPFEFRYDDLLKKNIYSEKEFMNDPENVPRTLDDLKKSLRNIDDWYYILCGSKEKSNNCNFYAAINESTIYRLQSVKWVQVKKLRLAAGTLLFGEMIKEKICNSKEKIKKSLHVIDAITLGDNYIAKLPFTERLAKINVYCQAVNHESRTNYIRVRAKTAKKLSELTHSAVNGNNYHILPTLGYDSIQESYEINSVLLLNSGKELLFNETFSSRIQVFIHKTEECKNDEDVPVIVLPDLIEMIQNMK